MKKSFFIFFLTLLLCMTFGCQNKEAMVELEAFKAQAEVEEQNKELSQKIFEAWGKGDFETFKQFFAPDHACFSPSISSKPISREEQIEMGKMLRKAFPDMSWSMEELIAEEDRAVTR